MFTKLLLAIVPSCHHNLEGAGLQFTKETETPLINLTKVTQLKSGSLSNMGPALSKM